MQIVKFFNYTFFASEMLVGYFGCWHFNLIGTVQGQHKRVKKVITLLNAKIGLNLELSTVWTFTHRLPAHRYQYSSGDSIFTSDRTLRSHFLYVCMSVCMYVCMSHDQIIRLNEKVHLIENLPTFEPRTFGIEVWYAIHWANGISISQQENLAI